MPDINTLLKLLTEFAWLGNWLFFTLAFIESAPFVGIFMPGATLVSIGGFLASQGILQTWDIVIFATLGAILGDFFSYSLGRWGGEWINNKKIINQTLLRHGEQFFYKYGNMSIFWGRFFGPLRAIIPFIAGVSRMKQGPFIFWNVISGICWAILNVFLGYFSGALIINIFKKWSGKITLVLILIFVAYILYVTIKKQHKFIIKSFKTNSLLFVDYLNKKEWFNKIKNKYIVVSLFFRESRHAPEKLFLGTLAFSFMILVYILILILDVF